MFNSYFGLLDSHLTQCTYSEGHGVCLRGLQCLMHTIIPYSPVIHCFQCLASVAPLVNWMTNMTSSIHGSPNTFVTDNTTNKIFTFRPNLVTCINVPMDQKVHIWFQMSLESSDIHVKMHYDGKYSVILFQVPTDVLKECFLITECICNETQLSKCLYIVVFLQNIWIL